MKKNNLKNSVLLAILLGLPFLALGQGENGAVDSVSQDALLIQGILCGDVEVVESAMANGAHLNQQLNGEGQTPLALAQARLREVLESEGDSDLEQAYEAIVRMLQDAFAPIYVMNTPVYDDDGNYIMRSNTTRNTSAFEIDRGDLDNLLMLIEGGGCNYAFR